MGTLTAAGPAHPEASEHRRFGWLENFWIEAAAFVAYLALRLLRASVRTNVGGVAELRKRVQRGEPVIVAFWHDHLMGMPLAYGGGPLRLLISRHRDGEIATRCIRRFGMSAVRGSSTRGGVSGLRRLLGTLREGRPTVVVPDGPRGPRHTVKTGIVQLARAAGVEIVPVGFHVSSGWRVPSWDRLIVPFPFARAWFVQGKGVTVARDASSTVVEAARRTLEAELERVTQSARAQDRRRMVVRRSRAGERERGFAGALYDVGWRALVWLARVGRRTALGRRWRLADRLGAWIGDARAVVGGRPLLWLHGASVGEVQGLRALIPALRARFPHHRVVVSAMTSTGLAEARRIGDIDGAGLFPLDGRRVAAGILEEMRPDLFAFTETELWPAWLGECQARGIPCVLLSGRVSDRAARRYLWIRPLLRPVLASVTACVQSDRDARRLVALGADARRVHVTGSLKAEAPLDPALAAEVARRWERVGVGDRRLLVGASTHPGEEVALLDAYAAIRTRCPELRLMLAPRHPERFDEVARLLDHRCAEWTRWSDLERSAAGAGESGIVLLDEMGILRSCFRFARVAFVGGTLATVGGHNVLEPAMEGCPVVFGPNVQHIREPAAALLASGGAVRVRDAGELRTVVERLVMNAREAAAMGGRARETAALGRGAVARHVDVIASVLEASVSRVACGDGR